MDSRSPAILIAVLLLSVLPAAAPVASAGHIDVPHVAFDAGAPAVTVGGVEYLAAVGGGAGPITYNSSWEVTVTNLPSSGAYTLTAEGASSGTQSTAILDRAHPGRYNVTFPAANVGGVGKFNQVGAWYVNGTGFSGRILVSADESLRVSLSRDAFAYSSGPLSVAVTVTDLHSGTPVSGANVTVLGVSTFTNADGVAHWAGATPPAGSYAVTASRNAGGAASQDPPEFVGETTLTIVAADIVARGVATDVVRGFGGTVEFNFTYPNGEPVFARLGPGGGLHPATADYRLNVTYPTGCWITYVGDTQSPYVVVAHAASTCIIPGNSTSIRSEDGPTKGNVVFDGSGANGWLAGAYAMKVDVNAADAGSSLTAGGEPEYSATATWTARQPEPVELAVVSGTVDGRLLVLDRSGTSANPGLPPPRSVTVRVSGSDASQHPVGPGGWDDFTTARNVTLEGDFLRLVDASGNVLAPTVGAMDHATGEFTVTDLFPARGGGEVRVLVDWKNATTTLPIGIGSGAALSASADQVPVGVPTHVTFTLRRHDGAADPYGEVRLYRATGAQATTAFAVIVGDGSPGRGLDGEYTFAVSLVDLGSYVAYGRSGPGGNATFAYAAFEAVEQADVDHADLAEAIRGSERRLTHLLGGLRSMVDAATSVLSGRIAAVDSRVADEGRETRTLVANSTSRVMFGLDGLGLRVAKRLDRVDGALSAALAEIAHLRHQVELLGARHDVAVQLLAEPGLAAAGADPTARRYVALVTVDGAPHANVTLAVTLDGAPAAASVEALGGGLFRVTLAGLAPGTPEAPDLPLGLPTDKAWKGLPPALENPPTAPEAPEAPALPALRAHALVVQATFEDGGRAFHGSALALHYGP